MSRDQQKQRVYEAEWLVRKLLATGGSIEILGSTLLLPQEIRFGDLAAIESYVQGIERTDWYQAAWPDVGRLRVEARRGRSSAEKQTQHWAHYQAGCIYIPATTWTRGDWAMRELVALHEIAHHVARDGHGPLFCGAFIHLVTNAIAPEAGLVLADALRGTNAQITYIAA